MQYIALSVPDAASARRAEVPGTVTAKAVLVDGVRVNAKDVGDFLGVEGTTLGRIGEQLAELVEVQLTHGPLHSRDRASGEHSTVEPIGTWLALSQTRRADKLVIAQTNANTLTFYGISRSVALTISSKMASFM